MKRKQKWVTLLITGIMMTSLAACSLPNLVVKQSNNNNGISNNNSISVNNNNPAPPVSSYEEPEFGIEYSYWLRLDDRMGSILYETDLDDVNYRLANYGNYITVYITNNGSEETAIGGRYRLQRLIEGEYVDLEDNMNLKYGDVYVQDMPRIILHNEEDGSEIDLTGADEPFILAPGQTVKVEFLTMVYPILDSLDYEGEYRLIYGDAEIDFRLFCDEVC